LSLSVSIGVAATVSLGGFLVVGGASLAGLVYRRRVRIGGLTLSLRSIPGSKDIVVSLALAVVAMALPLWHADMSWNAPVWVAVLLLSTLVFARTILYDMRDMQNDQIMGRDTLPILIGRRAARIVLVSLLALSLAASLAVNFLWRGASHPRLGALVLATITTVPVLHMWLVQDRFTVGRNRMGFLLESNFFLAGLLALL
jgi:4-hydroxy-3-methylbut-2-enyl diphosphate reductase